MALKKLCRKSQQGGEAEPLGTVQ
ncbi:uncharacterized protein G2W53_004755 [Senna tora]|uniref:Uncharacterized protein n=1 Tax=Senna tora TaxID=362788 RepID=A0A834XCR6_9FABA|nr:uncharacterized protein G2W53_004755 [Senna tora]